MKHFHNPELLPILDTTPASLPQVPYIQTESCLSKLRSPAFHFSPSHIFLQSTPSAKRPLPPPPTPRVSSHLVFIFCCPGHVPGSDHLAIFARCLLPGSTSHTLTWPRLPPVFWPRPRRLSSTIYRDLYSSSAASCSRAAHFPVVSCLVVTTRLTRLSRRPPSTLLESGPRLPLKFPLINTDLEASRRRPYFPFHCRPGPVTGSVAYAAARRPPLALVPSHSQPDEDILASFLIPPIATPRLLCSTASPPGTPIGSLRRLQHLGLNLPGACRHPD